MPTKYGPKFPPTIGGDWREPMCSALGEKAARMMDALYEKGHLSRYDRAWLLAEFKELLAIDEFLKAPRPDPETIPDSDELWLPTSARKRRLHPIADKHEFLARVRNSFGYYRYLRAMIQEIQADSKAAPDGEEEI
ncbi:hypothetical protein [Paramagnetospirillum magnetotacticum]|uniref:hypothetical protein n=1 Tax=Paramagnetospirillum magnetotacticum TaxID=188 RepID=UPI00059731D2|nr:hypothetical protein [Paramagnetospirillum magnetotacticum]